MREGTLSLKERIELLNAQQQQMQSTLSELHQRTSEIKESPAYQLMQHAQMMQLCGKDLWPW